MYVAVGQRIMLICRPLRARPHSKVQQAAHTQTHDLNTASPFMPLEAREREECRRRREGREGPGSVRRLKLQQWRDREVQRERERERQQRADGVAEELAVLALLHAAPCSCWRPSARILGGAKGVYFTNTSPGVSGASS
jgi:hypothetical protein